MAIQNDFEKKRKNAINWGGVFIIVAFITFLIFIWRIFFLQNNTDVGEATKGDIQVLYREDTIKAARGNLYAANGDILATTVIKYNVFLDFKVIKNDNKNNTEFEKKIAILADSLSAMFGKSRQHYREIINKQLGKENQYYSLVKDLDYEQMNRLKRFPIFGKYSEKTGEYKKSRGLIIESNYRRILATDQVGAGTIGLDRGAVKSGFEGAFSKYLSGKDGTRWVQRVNSTQWKPIDYWKIKDPIDGEDVYTTLDLRIQDIAHSALEKQLKEFNAHHGSVVVMEVATGKVRAMVNLTKTESGRYVDTYNYALRDATEPGSTFKTISLLAAMDDGFIDENTTVNAGGSWTYANQKITDGYSYGTLDISGVLAKSSNVGTAQLIVKHYKDSPQTFINHLKRWKMFDKLDIELPGATKPSIVTPEHKRWNRATLASLSYGYSSSFNLLQLATFYNGIANKGKMVKPLFIDKRMKDGKIIYEAQPEVLVGKMATDKAITMMTNALTKAVEKGTARSIFTPNLRMAGKTGTARFEYWKPGPMKYQASFAGFYPADTPLYTCVVMINQPQGSIYGGTVSAPVFKEIAGKTFLKTPLNIEQEMLKDKKVDLKKMMAKTPTIQMKNGIIPNIIGLSGKNIIPQLENLGYRVEYRGVGKIIEQFPVAGTPIKKNAKIYLKLQQ